MIKIISDLIQQYPKEVFYGLVILALLTSRIPYLGKVLRVINTMIHETGHALMALFLSGEVVKIDLFSDTSGKATTKSSSKMAAFFISLAGYPFASLFAFGTFYLFKKESYIIPVIVFASIALINLIFWVRNLYGIIWLIVFLGCSFGLFYLGDKTLTYLFAVFMSGILLVDSIISAGIVFYLSITDSKASGDAANLKEQSYIPAPIWGLLFFAQACFFGYLTIRLFL